MLIAFLGLWIAAFFIAGRAQAFFFFTLTVTGLTAETRPATLAAGEDVTSTSILRPKSGPADARVP